MLSLVFLQTREQCSESDKIISQHPQLPISENRPNTGVFVVI